VRAIVALTLILASTGSAAAQSRFEVGAGLTWTGGFDAGGLDPQLSRNPGTGTAPLTLYSTSSRLQPASGAVARAAVIVTPRLVVEATFEYSHPTLRVAISSDFEGATGSEATTQVSSYVFGGSVLYHLSARRLVPFVIAGAGRLRQLNDDNVDLVTGVELHAGGGAKYRLGRRVSLRADAVASSRDKSLAFETKRRTLPVVSASLAYRF
jgi:Outer membrane protein beta-barrel domain